MAGTIAGGRKAAAKNKEKYGPNFYSEIGKKGGATTHERGHLAKVGFGADRERAKIAGALGGKHRKGYRKHGQKTVTLERIENEAINLPKGVEEKTKWIKKALIKVN